MDGTLLDNMPFHEEAFNTFAARHGLPALTMETRKWMDGKRNRDIFPYLFSMRTLTPADVEQLADEKESLYRQLSKGRLATLPGLDRLLAGLEARGIPVSLATSAPRANVEHTLAELGLRERFAIIARSDEVAHGKPWPDVFLEAARLMQVAPERCLAFEDAPAGIIAARTAGMRCIGVSTSYQRDVLEHTDPPPHAVVANYNDFIAREGSWLCEATDDGVAV
jgi:beta-phosphoglucomutase